MALGVSRHRGVCDVSACSRRVCDVVNAREEWCEK